MTKRGLIGLGIVLCTCLVVAATAPSSDEPALKTAAQAVRSLPATPVGAQKTPDEADFAKEMARVIDGDPATSARLLQAQKDDDALKAEAFQFSNVAPPVDVNLDRACADCLTPNADFGIIGTDVWGYFTGTVDTATEGKWYARFDGEATAKYHFDLCPNAPGAGTGNFDADVKIVDSNCTIITGVDGSCSGGPNSYLPNDFQWTCVTSGTYYVVVAPYRSYNQHSCTGSATKTFDMNYYKEMACQVSCPGGAIPEPEACGSDANGGCNSTPPIFTTIHLGDTYCGTAWADASMRDTDWYELTLSEWTEVTWTVTSEFPSANFIISGVCGGTLVTEATAYGGNCQPVSAVKCLGPGTYYLFVATGNASGGIFSGYPCSSGLGDYYATVTGVSCQPYYCAAAATSTADETLKQVTLNTINNVTTNCDTYDDFTAISTDLITGSTYPFTVVIGDCEGTSCYTKWLKIYIDWNNDYDFADAGEQAFSSGLLPNTPCPDYTVTGIITVPVDAVQACTRMRVIVRETSEPGPCGTFTWGAVEDYTVCILPPPPTGACCFGASCAPDYTETDCTTQGGVFKGFGSTCSPINPCAGACCFADGSCQYVTGVECGNLGGNYNGDGTDCDPNPCPQPPPPNDLCVNAIPIGEVENLPFDTTLATDDGYGTHAIHKDIWYCYTASCSGLVNVDLCGEATWDTKVAVWEGCVCPPTVELAYDDDACDPGLQSKTAFNAVAGMSYLIQVGAYSATGGGPGALTVSCPPVIGACCRNYNEFCDDNVLEADCAGANDTWFGGQLCANVVCPLPPPPNDLCDYATLIPYVPYTDQVNMAQATDDTNVAPSCDSSYSCGGTTPANNGVWWTYTPAESCNATIGVTGEDTIIVVYTGADCYSLTEVLCSDPQTATVTLSAGVQYWILVSKWTCLSEPTNVITFTFDCQPLPTVGACCEIATGACLGNYSEPDCLAIGGTTWHGGEDCATFICPQPCIPDVIVNGPYPYTETNNTCGAGNDCDLRASEDIIYQVNIPQDGEWHFALCGATWDTYMYLATGCCSGVIAYDDDACNPGLQSEFTVTITAGTYYLIVEGYSSTGCGEYPLLIEFIPPCVVDCPPGATPEPEPCGDDLDGGCNATPPAFAPIMCGETVCGTGWANTSLRDTDWYELTAYEAAIYTWTVRCEFPTLIFVIDGTYGCGSYTVLASATGAKCTDVTITTQPLPAGTYWFWVGPSGWTDLPCPKDYYGTLTCVPVVGACCEPAEPYCEVLTEAACSAAGGTWLGIGTECATQLDCNSNGIPDTCEITLGLAGDCNHNGIPDDCDIAAGACDCQGDGIPDECQLASKARDLYQYDDGSTENSVGWTNGGELAWMTHYIAPTAGTVTAIHTSFGTPMYPGSSGASPGAPFRVHVYSDPDADGNPIDAVLLGSVNANIDASAIDSDLPQIVPVPSIPINGSFFVAASYLHPAGTYPAPLDETSSAGQGWLSGTVGGAWDPQDFTNLYYVDDYFPGNWLLRVEVQFGAPENDCNQNGIPDECDIGTQWGGFCAGQGGDCFPADCESDWNTNGAPDSCEVCGDLDFDGDVDMDDYWIFVNAFGTCVGNPKFVPGADMDGDGCITLVDYRAWRICYKMFNGKDFVLPKKHKAAGGATSPHGASKSSQTQ